jgi:inosine-uridine nucleoside N-ribohydrolase
LPPIPVILDTDLGDDIDDFWALAMLLRSPELRLRLVNTEYRDTRWRARVAAKFMEQAGRTDVSVSAGPRTAVYGPEDGRQRDYVAGYDVNDYPGVYRTDGVAAMADVIRAETDPVTVIAIAPSPALAELVRREPELIRRCRLVGMFGSVDAGYGGAPAPSAEWNVVADAPSCRAVLSAPWREIVLTPLDTCGLAVFSGAPYREVMDSADPLQRVVADASRDWSRRAEGETAYGAAERSSVLFDTVAVHLAYSEQFLRMEEMRLSVDDAGFTRRDPAGFAVRVALSWTDLDGYMDYLCQRLHLPVVR